VSRFRSVRVLAGAAGIVLSLTITAGGVLSTQAGAGLTSPPLVSATSWTNANAAPASDANQLQGVACPTSSFCVGVGIQNSSTGFDSLIEQWNGSTWSVASGIPADHGSLSGVSCAGPTFCLAVGGESTALSYLWNGSSWAAESVPLPPGTTFSILGTVSCPAINLCEAFGAGDVIGTPEVFGEQWNGSSWSLTSAAIVPFSGQAITPYGMDCVSASDCLTVGTTDNRGDGEPFAEQWNGSTWSLANTGIGAELALGSVLYGVSCVGGSWCQAVGVSAGSPNRNLIESWNGTQWTIEPGVPQPSGGNAVLRGVDCFSATSCSAIGNQMPTSGPSPVPFALEWNGTSWAAVSSPPVQGTVNTTLLGETCVTDWACMAVGSYATPGPSFDAYAAWAPIARSGYRFVASDGGVFAYGPGAPFLGSTGGLALNAPVVGMGVMPAGDGYYLVASDGGIFNYGSAQFDGSTGGMHLNQPVVGMAVTPNGGGYWLVASDGGIFNYGDAQFYGSRGGQPLNKPIVGMAATPDGKGYYLVASDGGIFNYGDAAFHGSTGGTPLNKPIVGMDVPTAGGYYLVASDGGIFSFPTGPGGPPFYGSTGSITLNKPIVGMAAVQGGYYLSGSDGGIFAFPTGGGGLPFYGSTGGMPLNKPIVGIAS
jgi:hypothetical protein